MEINSHQLAPSPNLESSLPPQPAPVPDSPLPAPSRSLSPWLLLPIFLIFLGISGYLFWQNRTLQSQLTASPSPTASAIAMAPTDPTADWQTYINNEHKVSFKYPSSWDLKIENAGDNDNGQTSNTVLFLTHEKAKISMTFNLVGIGGLGMDLEGEPFELDGIKLYKYHRTYSNGNQGIGITDQLKNTLGVFKVNGITYSFALSYPSNENGSAYEIIFDQILSTFKFIDDQENQAANWETYTNQLRKYSIKYPPNWNIDISEASLPLDDIKGAKLVISQGQYKITILWPSAFGPNMCLFDDESRDGAPEFASYCEGKFVSLAKDTHRRLEKPSTLSDHVEWSVYTKNSENYFVTVPPITLSAPINYDLKTVKIMDQILESYQSIK